MIKTIYIDPSYSDYNEDRLFDSGNRLLNRDDTLAPFIRMRDALTSQGAIVHTADFLEQNASHTVVADYYSFGTLTNFKRLGTRTDVRLRAFVIFEPPIVAPHLYRALPELTSAFDYVYVHNTVGDGYALQGVDQSKLVQLFWPQPHKGVLEKYWGKTDRVRRIVVINGNHKPKVRTGELYSRRIEAMAHLAMADAVDLYGVGWHKWWSTRSMWVPYWRHRRTLLSIYHGSCASKYETLSNYQFSLCFENMAMEGYVTEKIFDCLYAGTIPLYLGAPNIDSLIPSDIYIDCRKYDTWDAMWREVNNMSDSEITKMRDAGLDYLNSMDFMKYYDSMRSIIEVAA